MESSIFCIHAVETKISSKIFAHVMETPTVCRNYRIYHKNRTCMHVSARLHVVQWMGRVFYAISMNYLRYFREVFKLFVQKTYSQFMTCVPHGGWDVGPKVWLSAEEVWPGAHRRGMWMDAHAPMQSNHVTGEVGRASSIPSIYIYIYSADPLIDFDRMNQWYVAYIYC